MIKVIIITKRLRRKYGFPQCNLWNWICKARACLDNYNSKITTRRRGWRGPLKFDTNVTAHSRFTTEKGWRWYGDAIHHIIKELHDFQRKNTNRIFYRLLFSYIHSPMVFLKCLCGAVLVHMCLENIYERSACRRWVALKRWALSISYFDGFDLYKANYCSSKTNGNGNDE